MRNLVNNIIYFVLAILLIGSMGIWIPPIIEKVGTGNWDYFNALQNTSTYFITILVAGCIKLVARIVNHGKGKNPLGIILILLLIIVVAIGAVVGACFAIYFKSQFWAELIAISGTLAAYTMWWISNWNDSDVTPISALGGEMN